MRRSPKIARSWLEDFLETDPPEDCVEWPFTKTLQGYPRIGIKGRKELVTRWVLSQKEGPCPEDKRDAAHVCGNPGCVNWKHLYWATRSENLADRVRHGTANRGSRNGQCKLTESGVRLIRSDPRAYHAIAAEHGISVSQVYKIKKRKKWAWVV